MGSTWEFYLRRRESSPRICAGAFDTSAACGYATATNDDDAAPSWSPAAGSANVACPTTADAKHGPSKLLLAAAGARPVTTRLSTAPVCGCTLRVYWFYEWQVSGLWFASARLSGAPIVVASRAS